MLYATPAAPTLEAESRCITEDKIKYCWEVIHRFLPSLFLSFAICSISFSHFSWWRWTCSRRSLRWLSSSPRESSGLRSTEIYIHYNHWPSTALVTFKTTYMETRAWQDDCCFIYFSIPKSGVYFLTLFYGDRRGLNTLLFSAKKKTLRCSTATGVRDVTMSCVLYKGGVGFQHCGSINTWLFQEEHFLGMSWLSSFD